uniref:C2H2-type domain-containing protein n=1 Tax=Cacopsylla melanoneura TaxID=428564 RepID=A0A8D8QJ35_9HEMI
MQRLSFTTEEVLEHCQTCEKIDRNLRATRYTCILCPYNAYDRSKMRTHIRRHLGEKPLHRIKSTLDVNKMYFIHKSEEDLKTVLSEILIFQEILPMNDSYFCQYGIMLV